MVSHIANKHNLSRKNEKAKPRSRNQYENQVPLMRATKLEPRSKYHPIRTCPDPKIKHKLALIAEPNN